MIYEDDKLKTMFLGLTNKDLKYVLEERQREIEWYQRTINRLKDFVSDLKNELQRRKDNNEDPESEL